MFDRYARKNVRRYAGNECQKEMSDARMSEDMPQIQCPKICQKECQGICQQECQKICQKNVRRYARRTAKIMFSIHARKRVRLKCHGGDHSIQNDRTSFVGKRLQAPDLLSSTRRTMFSKKQICPKQNFRIQNCFLAPDTPALSVNSFGI